jgi:hypothetical protein
MIINVVWRRRSILGIESTSVTSQRQWENAIWICNRQKEETNNS